MIIGHQERPKTKEKIRRNFGMPAPEGYRKAPRLMEMAARSRCRSSPLSIPGRLSGRGCEERASQKPSRNPVRCRV